MALTNDENVVYNNTKQIQHRGLVPAQKAQQEDPNTKAKDDAAQLQHKVQIEADERYAREAERYNKEWTFYGLGARLYGTIANSSEPAVKHRKTASISLFDLPGEIRNQIYELAMPQYIALTIEIKRRAPTGHRGASVRVTPTGRHNTNTGMTRTCKQLRNETSKMCYSRLYLQIVSQIPDDHTILPRWLQKLGHLRVHHAKGIEITVPTSKFNVHFRMIGNVYSAKVEAFGFGDREDGIECANTEVETIVDLLKSYRGDEMVMPPVARPAVV